MSNPVHGKIEDENDENTQIQQDQEQEQQEHEDIGKEEDDHNENDEEVGDQDEDEEETVQEDPDLIKERDSDDNVFTDDIESGDAGYMSHIKRTRKDDDSDSVGSVSEAYTKLEEMRKRQTDNRSSDDDDYDSKELELRGNTKTGGKDAVRYPAKPPNLNVGEKAVKRHDISHIKGTNFDYMWGYFVVTLFVGALWCLFPIKFMHGWRFTLIKDCYSKKCYDQLVGWFFGSWLLLYALSFVNIYLMKITNYKLILDTCWIKV